MFGEYDPDIATQLAHLRYAESPLLFVILPSSASATKLWSEVEAELWPLYWEATHNGLVIDRLEVYFVDQRKGQPLLNQYGLTAR